MCICIQPGNLKGQTNSGNCSNSERGPFGNHEKSIL